MPWCDSGRAASGPSPGQRPLANSGAGRRPMSWPSLSTRCGCSPRVASASWGPSATGVFLRGALDRAHIEPLLAQRHEYKGAADRLMRTGFTPAGREATERLAASRYEQIVSAVASGRRLPEGRVRELIDRAPIPAAEAREAGLVDHLGYRDAVRQAVDRQLGDDEADPALCVPVSPPVEEGHPSSTTGEATWGRAHRGNRSDPHGPFPARPGRTSGGIRHRRCSVSFGGKRRAHQGDRVSGQ